MENLLCLQHKSAPSVQHLFLKVQFALKKFLLSPIFFKTALQTRKSNRALHLCWRLTKWKKSSVKRLPVLTVMYSNWLMRLWLTNSFNKQSCIAAMDWKLFISILSDYYKTVFFFSISRKWKTVKVLSFSRTVSQLNMRVHRPKVEYKLVHLYRKNPGEHLDVLVYKQF